MPDTDLAQERELGAATVDCPTCGKKLKVLTTDYKSLVPENCEKCYPTKGLAKEAEKAAKEMVAAQEADKADSQE